MTNLTIEQAAQKKQLLREKLKLANALYTELAEAGAVELMDDELEGAAGGGIQADRSLYVQVLSKLFK